MGARARANGPMATSATSRQTSTPAVLDSAGGLLRMLMIGYFEGIESERGIAWLIRPRCVRSSVCPRARRFPTTRTCLGSAVGWMSRPTTRRSGSAGASPAIRPCFAGGLLASTRPIRAASPAKKNGRARESPPAFEQREVRCSARNHWAPPAPPVPPPPTGMPSSQTALN